VCIVGYLRPETNFESLEALIDAIKKDISDAEELLDNSDHVRLKTDEFFTNKNGHIRNGHTLIST
jgi:riboflavin kinase